MEAEALLSRLKRLVHEDSRVFVRHVDGSEYRTTVGQLDLGDFQPGTEITGCDPEEPLKLRIDAGAAQKQPSSVGARTVAESTMMQATESILNRHTILDEERRAEIARLQAKVDELQEENLVLRVGLEKASMDSKTVALEAQADRGNQELAKEVTGLLKDAVQAINDGPKILKELREIFDGLNPDEKQKFWLDWGGKFSAVAKYFK